MYTESFSFSQIVKGSSITRQTKPIRHVLFWSEVHQKYTVFEFEIYLKTKDGASMPQFIIVYCNVVNFEKYLEKCTFLKIMVTLPAIHSSFLPHPTALPFLYPLVTKLWNFGHVYFSLSLGQSMLDCDCKGKLLNYTFYYMLSKTNT